MTSYPFSAEARGVVEAPAEVAFAFLDDQESPAYARWCTRIMVDDAARHFGHLTADLA
jgi:hypothetical protein